MFLDELAKISQPFDDPLQLGRLPPVLLRGEVDNCILIPFAIFQYFGWADFLSSIPMLIGCVLISAVIWWLFARVMTAKTLKGSRTYTAVLGFQEFMNRVDADRLKTMPPNTFEKFLPYEIGRA